MKNKTLVIALSVSLFAVLVLVTILAMILSSRERADQPAGSSSGRGLLSSGGGRRDSVDCGSGVMMEFARIPAGSFTMGSPRAEAGRDDDENQRRVTLTRPFQLGIYPVTQQQYDAVMDANPSRFKGRADSPMRPVETVTWDDAMEFCRRLSRKSGRNVRLPTEAEWEYACRAGTTTAYSFGETLTPQQANFDSVHSGTTPAGMFPANAWGLHDMHGNVWEWCADWYGEYAEGDATDPQGPANGPTRVLRGGSWDGGAGLCRSAKRVNNLPVPRSSSVGFRVALD